MGVVGLRLGMFKGERKGNVGKGRRAGRMGLCWRGVSLLGFRILGRLWMCTIVL